MAMRKQGEKLQQGADLGFHSRRRHGAKSSNHLEIFLASEKRVEVGFFRDVAEPLTIGDEVVLNVLALEEDLAASGLQQAGEDFDGGTFARTVGAQVSEYLAGFEAKRDFTDRGNRPVEFCESDCIEHGQSP
jgi:hypothetical protein